MGPKPGPCWPASISGRLSLIGLFRKQNMLLCEALANILLLSALVSWLLAFLGHCPLPSPKTPAYMLVERNMSASVSIMLAEIFCYAIICSGVFSDRWEFDNMLSDITKTCLSIACSDILRSLPPPLLHSSWYWASCHM